VRDLLREAEMPASRRPLVLLRFTVCEEERQLERLGKADEPELGRGRQRLGDIPAIEGTAEPHVSRALSGQEQMFAQSGQRVEIGGPGEGCGRGSRQTHSEMRLRYSDYCLTMQT